MEGCITLRKWTPRSEHNEPTPEVSTKLCDRTVAILAPIILKAIEPFVDAHRAMSLALAPFIVPQAAT